MVQEVAAHTDICCVGHSNIKYTRLIFYSWTPQQNARLVVLHCVSMSGVIIQCCCARVPPHHFLVVGPHPASQRDAFANLFISILLPTRFAYLLLCERGSELLLLYL